MNVISKILDEIKFTIPIEILNIVFSSDKLYGNNNSSIDNNILTTVLRPRLFIDLDIASHETIMINFLDCEILHSDLISTVIKVPNRLLNGRKIISPMALMVGYMDQSTNEGNYGYNSSTGNSILDQSLIVMDSINNNVTNELTEMELIADNTILVRRGMLVNVPMTLTLVISNDANLSNINVKVYKKLATMAVLCVKSYIRNNLIVKLNKGALYGGHDLDVINRIVDQYESSEEEYQTYYNEVWKKVSFMQNEKNMHDHITAMVGNVM